MLIVGNLSYAYGEPPIPRPMFPRPLFCMTAKLPVTPPAACALYTNLSLIVEIGGNGCNGVRVA